MKNRIINEYHVLIDIHRYQLMKFIYNKSLRRIEYTYYLNK